MNPTWMTWIGRILSAAVCPLFAFSAAAKLFPERLNPEMMQQMVALGLPDSIIRPIAMLEVACVALYLFPSTSVLGAILFTDYLGGAILTHLRVEQNVVMQVILGMVIWLGLFLREPRLRELIPLRRSE